MRGLRSLRQADFFFSPFRVQKLRFQPGNEPLHQGHTVEGGHEIEAVGVGQSLPGHLHRHLKAQRLALLPVEAREALDDVLLHMDAVDLVP